MATTRPNTPPEAEPAAPLIAEFLGVTVQVIMGDPTTTRTLVYSRDLTAAEMVVVERILRSFARVTVAEREALENDIAGLRTYQDLTSPTLAQTVLAVKAQSRILRALLRD